MQVAAAGRGSRLTLLLILLLGFGGFGALGCLFIGPMATKSFADDFGLWTSGLSAVAAGAVVVAVGRGRIAGPPRETFRLLLGSAVLLWGIGEVMLAVDLLNGPMAYPAPGDVVSALAAPLAVIALIRAPRSSRSDWPGVRLGLDALLLATGVTLLFWRILLISTGDPFSSDVVINAVICFADAAIFGIVLLVCLRDIGCRLWPAVLGVAGHALADLTGIFLSRNADADADRAIYWQAMALWSLAWPLIAIGLVRFRRSSPTADSDSARDRQEVVAGQVTVVLTFLAVAAGLIFGRPHGMDARAVGTLLLFGLLGLLLLARELINAYLRLRLADRLRAQAFQDELTGLPNRRALIERIAELDHGTRVWTVLTIDVDRFKEINDLLGQGRGDRLLIVAARALRESGSAELMVARIGADEFAVLAPGSLLQGAALAERLRAAVGAALEREAPGSSLTASVGVGRLVPSEIRMSDVRTGDGAGGTEDSVGSGDGARIEALAESSAALAAAKASGRDSVAIYTGPVAALRERRLRLEHRLRLAIAGGAIHTVAQPIVDLTTGRLVSFESLARWTDEELGPVPPDEFIAVAEQTGMVVALGEQLLAESLTRAARAGVFRAGLTISVNASPIQLRLPGYVDLMRLHLDRLRIPAAQVVVEITEAILVDEDDPAVPVLAELRSLGVELAIDDFGTGYSALGYLRRLPVQVLKIDKSLTQTLASEPKTLAIVDGVVATAHRLGIRVVMEGIETEDEARRCRALAADRGQGWLYGRGQPWAEVADAVANQVAAPPNVPHSYLEL